MELEAAIVACDNGLHALPILSVCNRDSGSGERPTSFGIDNGSGNSVSPRRDLRERATREHRTSHHQRGHAPACAESEWPGWVTDGHHSHSSLLASPLEMAVPSPEITCNWTCSVCPADTRTTGPLAS